MIPLHATIFLFALVAASQEAAPPRADCRAWQECRQLAAEAEARKDYEAFHDLAWRAMQTGPKNDPQLMYMLARAQSLSGRPGDALVMLQRLSDMGVANDADSHDDFQRVRALPGWQAFRATREARTDAAVATSLAPARPDTADAARTKPKAEETSETRPRVGGPSKADAHAERLKLGRSSPGAATESLRFTTLQFTPAGLAYDAVSRRFIVGDRHARKLAVVDEFSQHVANLASAQTAGFGEIAALEIDPRLGHLWVVSVDADRAVLHKLQLVSGRSLGTYEAASTFGPTRFADVAAAGDGAVLLLDAAGRRLFRLRSGGQSLELAVTLTEGAPSSMAPAGNATVYVAHDGGLARVNMSARTTAPVKAATGVDLSGIARIRWLDGSLAAVQKAPDGTYRAIRILLNRSGGTAVSVEILDPSLSTADPTAASISGGVLYYLANGPGTEMIVKKILLRKAER